MSEDPLRFGAGVNFYPYALGNPMTFVDPDGMDVTITIGNRVYSPSGNSISGTITVTSDQTSITFSGYTLENSHPGDDGSQLPVPGGTYPASVRTDHTPNRIELKNVPGFNHIQIHNGSYPGNFKGCFGAGTGSSPDFLAGTKDAMNQINGIIHADGTGRITVIVNSIQNKPHSGNTQPATCPPPKRPMACSGSGGGGW